MTILMAATYVCCQFRAVCVVEPPNRFVQRAGAEVEIQVGLSANPLAPVEELVGAERVWLETSPMPIAPNWSPVLWPYSVLPVIDVGEAPSRPTYDRDCELLHRLDHIDPKPFTVGELRRLIDNRTVDALVFGLDVFKVLAEDHGIDRANGP